MQASFRLHASSLSGVLSEIDRYINQADLLVNIIADISVYTYMPADIKKLQYRKAKLGFTITVHSKGKGGLKS